MSIGFESHSDLLKHLQHIGGKMKQSKKEIVKSSKTDVEKKSLPTSLKVEVKKLKGNKNISFIDSDNHKEIVQKSTGFDDTFPGMFVLEKSLITNTDISDTAKQLKLTSDLVLAVLADLNPNDGFEGMLISQMITIFNQAMNCIKLANRNQNNSDSYIKFQNQGVKLMRVYNQQLEALDKHRRKGNQKMTVEHVNVHKGGQAIVGEVHHGEG